MRLKGGRTTLYERILKEYQRLGEACEAIKRELSSLPEGKLICCHEGTKCKWYRSNGHKKVYLPKKEQTLAMQLARKKYLTLKAEELEKEKRALKFYLDHHVSSGKAEALLTETSEYQKLLSGQFIPISTEIEQWQSESYEKNNMHPEHLICKSISGNLLRSKSEMMIDMLLFQHKIPFRYECALVLGGAVIHPDFTIRHPLTGKFFYWEHFGLMDKPEYVANTLHKMRTYAENGILPGINLITTYETQENPLDSEWVEKIIEHYLL